jgi:hypothetical protein
MNLRLQIEVLAQNVLIPVLVQILEAAYALDGNRPDDVFFGKLPETPPRDAKSVPTEIETRYFRQARITGYLLKKAG